MSCINGLYYKSCRPIGQIIIILTITGRPIILQGSQLREQRVRQEQQVRSPVLQV